jgi:hypothetical protein
MKCLGFALSVYDSFNNAKKAFENVIKRFKNFPKIVGHRLAQIEVKKDDGLATEPAMSGHFDFFEYANTDLRTKIVDVQKLIV